MTLWFLIPLPSELRCKPVKLSEHCGFHVQFFNYITATVMRRFPNDEFVGYCKFL